MRIWWSAATSEASRLSIESLRRSPALLAMRRHWPVSFARRKLSPHLSLNRFLRQGLHR